MLHATEFEEVLGGRIPYLDVRACHRSASSGCVFLGSAQFRRLLKPIVHYRISSVPSTYLREVYDDICCSILGGPRHPPGRTLKTGTGVLFSMGNGMLLAHWLKKRLGLALACMFAGASIGGCIFPIIVKALLQRTRCGTYFAPSVHCNLTSSSKAFQGQCGFWDSWP